MSEQKRTHSTGETVTCIESSGYMLTTGKQYKVIDVVPEHRHENGHVSPSYVRVINDEGKPCTCHHYRFANSEV